MPYRKGTYLTGIVSKNAQIATEAHGKTRKNKSLTGNISVCFRVFPWQSIYVSVIHALEGIFPCPSVAI